MEVLGAGLALGGVQQLAGGGVSAQAEQQLAQVFGSMVMSQMMKINSDFKETLDEWQREE
jgi:hypothetical protein